jgi:hypothetical protein
VLEFFATTVLQDHLALLISALVFFAPLFVLLDVREEDKLFAIMAGNLKDLDEFL